ncbi:MAG: MlaE family ABC transporter permease [Syntrophobacteraceae bacterium]
MRQSLIEMDQSPEGETVFIFKESLTFGYAKPMWENARYLLREHSPQFLVLDFGQIETIDSSGLSLLRLLWRHCTQHQIKIRYASIPPSAEYFLRYVESEPPPRSVAATPHITDRIAGFGHYILKKKREWHELVQLVGDFVLASLSSLFHARRFRWKEMFYYAQLSGADAVPIVFLLSFLIGLVMAFQGAVQLRQFGANIYVADLLSLALARELSPIFTAIILAGRSGSAFAAEIGTMKVNEEVDALVVMGFDITNFLVLPKVFALVLCGPLLTILSNASGILGGIVVGVLTLDLTAMSFLEEAYQVLSVTDILSGLIKSVVFAALIGLIGCFRGLQAEKGADSVGRQTTSAVVSGIFLIILADAVFTILFHVFSW